MKSSLWLLVVIGFLILGITAFAEVVVEQTPPINEQQNQTISPQTLAMVQQINIIQQKINNVPTKDEVDALLATQLKLEKDFLNQRIDYLTIAIVLIVVCSVVGVAATYFIMKSRGRL